MEDLHRAAPLVEHEEPVQFTALPAELHVLLGCKSSPGVALALAQCCRQLHTVMRSDDVWRHWCAPHH